MKNKINNLKYIFLILFILSLCPDCIIHAHPGRTDSAGGHYDSSTGEYHYHHGYPAHQHKNGICPYDSKNSVENSSQSTPSNTSSVKGNTMGNTINW